jgi:subtilisin family serine protease
MILSAAAAAAVFVSGSGLAARPVPTTEVVVTLRAPALTAFGRSLTSAPHRKYARELAAAQTAAQHNIVSAIPSAQVRWRYRLVANGFAVVVPTADLGLLARVPGVAKIWPNVTYHSLRSYRSQLTRRSALTQGPQVIGADKLWGPALATAGQGMKIGVIDDGIEASHAFFDAAGFTYPAGFPKGQTSSATPKVIVQRTFAPAFPQYEHATAPFDPTKNGSFHGTHVAGIAAGDHATPDGALTLSGVAPSAYLGNYKALAIPTPGFGLDGNSAEIAAGIEAAVADGMDVINLSLGEPEVEPSRDLVVHAIDEAARAGVIPVIAAGNDFDQFGYGSISSPANAPDAITVAATTESGTIADFSSAGPTPVSLALKPDVSAPGVSITSSLPRNQNGPFGELSGTSMATPHVAGGAALLKERHPTWTVAEIKSALVQTGDPVRNEDGRESSVLREGGGLINLVRADNPLLFASPTGLAFPVNGGTRTVNLTDAGGGGGPWSVTASLQEAHTGVDVTVEPTVTIPGAISVTSNVSASAHNADVTGFVLLTRGTDVRRIPFWVAIDHPLLANEPIRKLTHRGIYEGTTKGGATLVARYRYPTRGDTSYPGPEVVYRVHISHAVANFGVAVLSGGAIPHVVFAGDENHLVGYPGLPINLNPYFQSFGESRPVAGAVLPSPGNYEIVFDTRSEVRAGPFKFRYWVNDTTPPELRVLRSAPGTIAVSITDAGSGVDAQSIRVTIDEKAAPVHIKNGKLVLQASAGSHRLVVTASDHQELKNMEDVAKIKPNTATLRRTVVVRQGPLTA